MNILSVVVVDGFVAGGRRIAGLLSGSRALGWLSRELASESLEATVGHAVEQAFAEFARELRG
jgi:hypothetical protein